MSEQFYIRHGGRVQGPFPVEKLHEMFRRGRFSRAFQVSTDGSNWQRAGDVPDLFPAAPSTGRAPRSAPMRSNVDADPERMQSDDIRQADSNTYGLQSNLSSGAQSPGSLWHYTSNDVEQPPVPLEQLQDLVRAGSVQRNDQVWSEGMLDWMTAGQVPELRDYFPASMNVSTRDVGDQQSTSAASGHTQTAPMAVASLVLGLLGMNALILVTSLMYEFLRFDVWYRVSMLFILGSILAVIFGHIALRQIRESNGRLGGQGLAVAGLIFGYGVVAISIIVGIVLFVIETTDR